MTMIIPRPRGLALYVYQWHPHVRLKGRAFDAVRNQVINHANVRKINVNALFYLQFSDLSDGNAEDEESVIDDFVTFFVAGGFTHVVLEQPLPHTCPLQGFRV